MAGMGIRGFFLHRLVGPLIPGMVVGVMQQRIRMQISCFFFSTFCYSGGWEFSIFLVSELEIRSVNLMSLFYSLDACLGMTT